MSEVEDELAALGRFEQGLATARSAVEELARTGDLAAADASMLLLGLSALDSRAVRKRRSVSALGNP
jgi:hypothetical protein